VSDASDKSDKPDRQEVRRALTGRLFEDSGRFPSLGFECAGESASVDPAPLSPIPYKKAGQKRHSGTLESLELVAVPANIQQRSAFRMGIGVTRAAFYVRVSTGEQTVENQLQALHAIADRRGWEVAAIYRDEGISGSKTRQSRPGLDQMLKDAQRRKFDIVAAWSIDRLGRSLADLLETLAHLKACGVALYVDRQNLDTMTPIGEAMFQMVGVFAQFERELIRERVKAGMARAVAAGKRIGRPATEASRLDRARAELTRGTGILKTAKLVGIGVGTAQRIKKEMLAQTQTTDIR